MCLLALGRDANNYIKRMRSMSELTYTVRMWRDHLNRQNVVFSKKLLSSSDKKDIKAQARPYISTIDEIRMKIRESQKNPSPLTRTMLVSVQPKALLN